MVEFAKPLLTSAIYHHSVSSFQPFLFALSIFMQLGDLGRKIGCRFSATFLYIFLEISEIYFIHLAEPYSNLMFYLQIECCMFHVIDSQVGDPESSSRITLLGGQNLKLAIFARNTVRGLLLRMEISIKLSWLFCCEVCWRRSRQHSFFFLLQTYIGTTKRG